MNGPNATVTPTGVRPARNLSWVGPALVILFAALLMAGAAHLLDEPSELGSGHLSNFVFWTRRHALPCDQHAAQDSCGHQC